MTDITLESLGLDQDKLAEKLVDRLAQNMLTSIGYDEDGEDGEDWFGTSPFAKKLNTLVKARLDQVVNDLADKHVLPRVNEMVETLVLQRTNQWGEKVGNPVTFKEYLCQRAEAYMQEEVSYEGKPKGTDSFSWRAQGTRVAYMIDKHLHYSIESAMKDAFQSVNTSIAKGLEVATKQAISDVTSKLKVTVATK
ncbi:hypothetical protein [Mesorhizobium sp. B2-5-11]|uniref:hypothetical protein n=1 Tax=Mesorhizobium sp. B2-5-11 TaxID=2589919 RepID=UPI0011283CA0|nr:hypothetical protein [Mesorhizobium sp. B2-5-11]TPK14131.1 hypothetical protein FJ490_02070 [Mesorhizobium sp. B2-5-11]